MKRLAGKVVYLAGPMSGITNFNFEAFESAESLLWEHSQAKAVVNPARHPYNLELAHYYQLGVTDARNADVIVLLPGWRESRGVAMELSARGKVRHGAEGLVNLMLGLRMEVVRCMLAPVGTKQLDELGAVELVALEIGE